MRSLFFVVGPGEADNSYTLPYDFCKSWKRKRPKCSIPKGHKDADLLLCPSKATSYLAWNSGRPTWPKCWVILEVEAFNASCHTHVFNYSICSECLFWMPKSPPASCPFHLNSLDDMCSGRVLCIHFLKREKNVFTANLEARREFISGEQKFLWMGFRIDSEVRPI